MTFKKNNKFWDNPKAKEVRFRKEHVPWNKGLTKETDERVKNNGISQGITMKKLYTEGKLVAWSKNKTKDNCESLKKTSQTHKINDNNNLELIEMRRQNTLKQWQNPEFREFVTNNSKNRKMNWGDKVSKTKLNRFLNESYKEEYLNKNKGCFKKGQFSREKHPMWKGGLSFEPYDEEFNINFKNFIRKRDNQICMNCGIHREKLVTSLNIHHIDYNKLNSIPQNCISLCKSCHSLTNINRDYWKKLFQEKLVKLYHYQYSPSGEIILNIGIK